VERFGSERAWGVCLQLDLLFLLVDLLSLLVDLPGLVSLPLRDSGEGHPFLLVPLGHLLEHLCPGEREPVSALGDCPNRPFSERREDCGT